MRPAASEPNITIAALKGCDVACDSPATLRLEHDPRPFADIEKRRRILLRHFANWRKVRAPRLTIAGTSADLIIAGLIAVGYTADELFSEDQSSAWPFNQSYLHFFGRDEWQKGKELWSEATGLAEKLNGEASGIMKAFAWMKLGILLKRAASQQAVGSLGYFSAEAFKQWYNKLLDAKIQKTGSDRTVRFSDVDFNLKIVSADVSASELVVHSRETCPDRPIAEAVAASISIPLFFQPQKIDEGNLHVDGGILSNFPAWLFLDETEADVRPPRGSPGLTLAVL